MRLGIPLIAVLPLLAGCPERAEPLCEITELPEPQLRLLTRAEYDRTVDDLLGVADASCDEDSDCDLTAESCVGSVCTSDPCNLVTFVLPADGPYGSVHVAGAFNDWSPTVAGGWPMTWVADRGLYFAKRAVGDGTWEYKFVIDESDWRNDPNNPEVADDGFGGVNSVLALQCDGAAPVDATASPSEDFPVESRPPGFPFTNSAEAGLVTSVHVEQYLRAGQKLAGRYLDRNDPLGACSDRSCVEAWLTELGGRAWRRPLTADEVQRYADLVLAFSDREDGMAVAMQALLSSPHFLYRSEVGTTDGDGRELDAYEVASALSYMLWGTMPDTVLRQAAAAGTLATPQGIAAQARRLLDDPRSEAQVARFGRQWLGVDAVLTVDRSASMFPAFDDARRHSLHQQAGRFVAEAAFAGPGGFTDLMSADWTVADTEVAEHIGAAAPDGWSMVDAPGRPGVLGLPAVLATYAHSDQTSPVRRGLFLRDRLLCQELPAPPPTAGGVPEVDPDATTRERFGQHSDDPACSSCHRFIDPVGFAFEGFDAVGVARTQDAGAPIDTSGRIEGLEALYDDSSVDFGGIAAMARLLAESESAPRCFSRQWYRYSFGRLDDIEDVCAVDHLQAAFLESGGDIKELLVAITQLPGFTRRRSP